MKIKTSIYSLIDSARKELEKIESISYDNNKGSPEDLAIDIKHFLEDLRSSLDYLANQIFTENCSSNDSAKKYFPLFTKNFHGFKSHMGKNLPNLDKKNPTLYSELENIQFYNDIGNREWMKDLRIVNEYKHEGFPKQHKEEEKDIIDIGTKESPSVIQTNSKAKNFTIRNVMINETPIDFLRINEGRVYGTNTGIKITKTKTGGYYFSKIQKPVIPTLKKMLDGVNGIIEEFEK